MIQGPYVVKLISVPVNVAVRFTIFLRTTAKEVVSVDTYVTTYVSETVLVMTSILKPISSLAPIILADKVGRERTVILFKVITLLLCCLMLSIAYYYKSYLLTFYSLRLALCTTSFNIQKFCFLPTMHLCILRES